MESLCLLQPADKEQVFPEVFDIDSLRRSVYNNATRLHNVKVKVDMYQSMMQRATTAGRTTDDRKAEIKDACSSLRKLQLQEKMGEDLFTHVQSLGAPAADNADMPGAIHIQVKYRTKYEQRSRRMVIDLGLAPLRKSLQVILAPDLHEWDVKACAITLLTQMMTRIKPVLDHQTCEFNCLSEYLANRTDIHASISPSPAKAKQIVLGVLNGMRIPEHLNDHAFLNSLKREGRLLRWIACTLNPTFHTTILEHSDKEWPEATTFFYTWSAVEDWVIEALSTFAMALHPSHLSLHYDGIKIDPACYTSNAEVFRQSAESYIADATGYNVTLERKESSFLLDLMVRKSHFDVLYAEDDVFNRLGNCTPAALSHIRGNCSAIRDELKRRIKANKDAETYGSRSYRSCMSQFGCVLCPLSIHDIDSGSYVLHVEDRGNPHSVSLIVRSSEATFVHKQRAWRIALSELHVCFASAVDASSAFLISVHPPGSPHATGPMAYLLDLHAGAPSQMEGDIYERLATSIEDQDHNTLDTIYDSSPSNAMRRAGIDIIQEKAVIVQRAARCAHLHINTPFQEICVAVALHNHGLPVQVIRNGPVWVAHGGSMLLQSLGLCVRRVLSSQIHGPGRFIVADGLGHAFALYSGDYTIISFQTGEPRLVSITALSNLADAVDADTYKLFGIQPVSRWPFHQDSWTPPWVMTPNREYDVLCGAPRLYQTKQKKCTECEHKLHAHGRVTSCTVMGSESLVPASTRSMECCSRSCRAVYRPNFRWSDGRKINSSTIEKIMHQGVYFVTNKLAFTVSYLTLCRLRLLRAKVAPGQEAAVQHLFRDDGDDSEDSDDHDDNQGCLLDRVSLRDHLLHALEGFSLARAHPGVVVEFDVNFPAESLFNRNRMYTYPPSCPVNALTFDGHFGIHRHYQPGVDPRRTVALRSRRGVRTKSMSALPPVRINLGKGRP